MALSNDQLEEIKSLYSTGQYSNRKIAELVGVGNKVVGTVARKLNLISGITNKNIRRKESNIYVIRAGKTDFYKIGVANDVGERLKALQTGHYEDLLVRRTYYSSVAYEVEKRLHQKYRDKGQNIKGEWFILSEDDINDIDRLIYGNR